MNPKAIQILLKSFGLDPEKIKAQIENGLALAATAAKQFDAMQAQMNRIEHNQNVIMQALSIAHPVAMLSAHEVMGDGNSSSGGNRHPSGGSTGSNRAS